MEPPRLPEFQQAPPQLAAVGAQQAPLPPPRQAAQGAQQGRNDYPLAPSNNRRRLAYGGGILLLAAYAYWIGCYAVIGMLLIAATGFILLGTLFEYVGVGGAKWARPCCCLCADAVYASLPKRCAVHALHCLAAVTEAWALQVPDGMPSQVSPALCLQLSRGCVLLLFAAAQAHHCSGASLHLACIEVPGHACWLTDLLAHCPAGCPLRLACNAILCRHPPLGRTCPKGRRSWRRCVGPQQLQHQPWALPPAAPMPAHLVALSFFASQPAPPFEPSSSATACTLPLISSFCPSHPSICSAAV